MAASAALAIPGLAEQWTRSKQLRGILSGKDTGERASLLDNPIYGAAHEIASVVPADGCVTVLAYAGPDAIDYYNARLDYLLYPRRVHVVSDSSAQGCGFIAVMRDTSANLAASPFAGTWDEGALSVRLAELALTLQGALVEVYQDR